MSKNFMQNGRWIDNPNTVIIVKCRCGNKYIKTRLLQDRCLTCLKVLREAQPKF
jgi:hypothetical protein